MRPGPAPGFTLAGSRGQSAGNPIGSDIELAQRLRELCGADGFRYENGLILALRWDTEGNEVVIDRFQAVGVNG